MTSADGNNRAIQSPFSHSALPSRRKQHRLLGATESGKVAVIVVGADVPARWKVTRKGITMLYIYYGNAGSLVNSRERLCSSNTILNAQSGCGDSEDGLEKDGNSSRNSPQESTEHSLWSTVDNSDRFTLHLPLPSHLSTIHAYLLHNHPLPVSLLLRNVTFRDMRIKCNYDRGIKNVLTIIIVIIIRFSIAV